MTRIGVTGHQDLPAAAIDHARIRVEEILGGLKTPLVGYSSLAEGADQLVASEILKAGGELHIVVPCEHYETTFEETVAKEYERLLRSAAVVTQLPYPEPSSEAYDAAGAWIAEQCDVMIAVWDGQPARGRGGTADAVAHARALSKDVHIVWPSGVRR
jgi:hypothetical protein